MVQNARSRIIAVTGLASTLIILSVLAVSFANMDRVKAEDTSDLRALLQRLDARMRNERGFLVTINFSVQPGGRGKSWVLNDPKDKESFSISEIGSNYLCFERIGGQAELVICTPFSNIVSVYYLNN